MKRQPRVDFAKSGNYNFEQFSRYTRTYEKAREADDKKSEHFYKLTKYVKENIENKADNLVHKFTEVDGLRPDLISIPEEFDHLTTENVAEEAKEFKGRGRGKLIRTRSSKSLHGYDAWRVMDRAFLKADGYHYAVHRFYVAPAVLIRRFGDPANPELFFQGTGKYSFEDSNLDLYQLYDFKQTDHFHGLNRDDDFYTGRDNMKKPLHKRKRKWPTVEEFWTSEEPVPFKLLADDQAQWRKFRKWLKKTIAESEETKFDYEKDAEKRFGSEVDICLGNYH